MNQAYNSTIQASLQVASDLLADFVNQPHIGEKLAIAFGDSFDTSKGISILTSLVEDNELSNLPQLEIRPAQEINQFMSISTLRVKIMEVPGQMPIRIYKQPLKRRQLEMKFG